MDIIAAFLSNVLNNSRHMRLTGLIAARNEERVVGSLAHSLKAQAYPQDLYDIFVIPNNCAADT